MNAVINSREGESVPKQVVTDVLAQALGFKGQFLPEHWEVAFLRH